MPDPGFYPDYDEATYHADQGSLSVSGAKTLLKAPALYQWERTHPVQKDVWDRGSAAHALALGRGMESIYVTPVSEFRTNVAKAEKAEARRVGLAVITPEVWVQVSDMAEELSKHRLAMELMSAGEPEVSAWCVDETTGVMRRSRFDYLADDVVIDYKSSRTAQPDAFLRAAFDYGYHSQDAWYLDMVRDLGHPARSFAFVVQEPDPPYLVTVVELPAELRRIGRRRNARALEMYRDCTATNLWPGYLPDTDFATPEAPAWMLRDDR